MFFFANLVNATLIWRLTKIYDSSENKIALQRLQLEYSIAHLK